MKRLAKCQLMIVLGIVVLNLSGCSASPKPVNGSSKTEELTLEPVEFGYGNVVWFLVEEPVVTGFDGSSATVKFETIVPAPSAKAYYGVILPEEELQFPHYRKEAKESLSEGETSVTKHQIKVDISKLENVYYDTGLVENGGGVIVYRIEVFDTRISATRFYNGRFRYKREGDPKTGVYTKCVTLTEGPFVDRPTHDSVVISWETDQASRGAVMIEDMEVIDGAISSRHELLITGLRPDSRYVYRVRCSDDDSITRGYSFRTAPAPGSRRAFKFGFMSDSREGVGGGEHSIDGVNYKELAHFTTALYRKDAEFILFGGDLVTGYTSNTRELGLQFETWKRAIQPVGARIPIYEAMGNHEQMGNYYRTPEPEREGEFMLFFASREGKNSAEACFAQEFVNPHGSVYSSETPSPETRAPGLGGAATGPSYAENVYSFSYGNVHFAALNSDYWYTGHRNAPGYSRKYADEEANNMALKHLGGNRPGYIRSNQLAWLQQDLQAAQEDANIDWVFLYLHEPAFPNGGHLRDAMYWKTKEHPEGYNNPDAPLGDVVDMRNRFWRIVSKYDKVLAVMCGHEHNYSRTLVDSTIHSDYQTPVWQIISGACGAPYYVQDESAPWAEKVQSFAHSKHYCLFTVDGDKVSLTVYSDADQILDHVENLATVK